MKQIIVMCAVLPLLLLFVSQFALDQQHATTNNFIYETIDVAKEQAKRDGCFTVENMDNLQEAIADRLKVKKDEIIVIATNTPKYRTNDYQGAEQIYYRVEIPVKKIMAGAGLLGIEDEDNQGKIIIENSVSSELLAP